MAASLLNKAVDLGFALIVFRVLQAEGVGAYTFAGVLTTYFDIVVGYGLAALITRDVARDPTQAGRYLGNATVLRLLLWLGAVGVTALLVGPLGPALGIGEPLALAIWLLVLGLLPGLLSGVVSALFMAHERMDVPAAVTVFSTLSKVVLGLVALLSGMGLRRAGRRLDRDERRHPGTASDPLRVADRLAAPQRRRSAATVADRRLVPADDQRAAQSVVLQDRRSALEAIGR